MRRGDTPTRHEHYASLPASERGSKKAKHWTWESACVALRLFIAEEGRYPAFHDLSTREGMPSYETVRGVFGSLKAYQAQEPQPASPYAREVACPRCDGKWMSQDCRYFRICDTCHATAEWHGDGSWMNGDAVIYNGSTPMEGHEEEWSDGV